MPLRIIGAGLPRTGTSSLRAALQALLGGPCLHMSAIPGHPFDLGPGWRAALAGQPADWPRLLGGYVAAAACAFGRAVLSVVSVCKRKS